MKRLLLAALFAGGLALAQTGLMSPAIVFPKADATSPGELRLFELYSNGTNYVSLLAPSSLSNNLQFTLPSSDGSAGYCLVTDGNGTLSFSDCSVSVPVTSVFGRTGAVTAASGDYNASQITNTPAGGISATDVQAAINELDSEKAGKTGQFTYTFFDPANDLPDTLDVPSIYMDRAWTMTITEVTCEINGGSAAIQLQRDDGSPVNMLSSDLVCSTAGASTTSFVSGENVLSAGQNLDHVTVSVGAGLRRINVAVKYTIQ